MTMYLHRYSCFIAIAFGCLGMAAMTEAQDDLTQDRRYNAVTWVQNAAEYRMAARQAYRLAQVQLDKGLADKEWTADFAQRASGGYRDKKPAIILDVDETVLNNSPYSARGIVDEEDYSTASWNAWVEERKAQAVPGAVEFVRYAISKGVAVFFVTNRTDQVRQATIDNLKTVGFPATQANVLTKNSMDGRGSKKLARRAAIAAGHRIVLLIGDNMGDFCVGVQTDDQEERNRVADEKEAMLGACWIILPNPIYGGWVDALDAPNDALDLANNVRRLRVATYNIRWLSSETTQCGSIPVTDVRTQADQFGTRLTRLRAIVESLDADVIGLQEIRDRKALELIFGTDGRWTIVIDDDSDDCQDLALAVRKPLTVVGAEGHKLDADDEHFLAEDVDEHFFPGRRDVLDAEIKLPGSEETVHVLVHHAKSRSGGRKSTNRRRAEASKAILKQLQQRFAGKYYILLGDFNDGPDDRSLNILETGKVDAPAKIEDEPGEFLINLTESLVAKDIVTHGRSWSDVRDKKINLVQRGSRTRNFTSRNSNVYDRTLDVLLDQILVPQNVHPFYMEGSVQVYDDAVAVSGKGDARASDHLPVYADFNVPLAP